MHFSAVDQAFWFAAFAGQAILAGVLLYRRQYLAFPVFLTYIVVTIVFDAPLYWVSHHGSSSRYEQTYIIATVIDYMLQLGVLTEIAYRVLRPGRQAMPKALRITMIGSLLVVCLTTLIWTFSRSGASETFEVTSAKLIQISFVFSFLRLIVFALIAGFSQMLGVTWRNHVIRLASGLAFYSAVSVVAQLTISHLSTSNVEAYYRDFHLLLHTQLVGYLLALVFWVWSFVQKDAPRREFTPQMERFLVTISETARRSRVGFTRSMGHK